MPGHQRMLRAQAPSLLSGCAVRKLTSVARAASRLCLHDRLAAPLAARQACRCLRRHEAPAADATQQPRSPSAAALASGDTVTPHLRSRAHAALLALALVFSTLLGGPTAPHARTAAAQAATAAPVRQQAARASQAPPSAAMEAGLAAADLLSAAAPASSSAAEPSASAQLAVAAVTAVTEGRADDAAALAEQLASQASRLHAVQA
jgi:hypothetical protein